MPHHTFHLTEKNFDDCFVINDKFNVIVLHSILIRLKENPERELDFVSIRSNIFDAKTNLEKGVGVPVFGEIMQYSAAKEFDQPPATKKQGYSTEFTFYDSENVKINPKDFFKSVTIQVEFIFEEDEEE
jgi:hypothetical protein